MQSGAFLSLPCMRLPTPSPDGDRIAYVAQGPDLQRDGYVGTLYVADAGGSARPVPYGTFGGAASALSWLDGQTLLLAVGDALWRVDDGAAPVRLWQAPGTIASIAPNPGSGRLAISVLDAVADADAARRLTTAHHKWDGRGALPGAAESVWLVDLQDPDSSRRAGADGTAYRQAAWSPDGRHLAAVARRMDERIHNARIVLLTAQGQEVRELTPAADVLAFAWTPDAAGLVFASRTAPFGSCLPHQIHTADLEGHVCAWADSGESLVAPLVLCDWRWPSLRTPFLPAPDAQSVVTLVQEGGAVVARRFFRDGSCQNDIGGRGQVVSDLGSDASGHVVAYTLSDHTSIDDIYVRGADGAVRRLTDAMSLWPSSKDVLAPTFFTVRAPDGVQSDCAWLSPPGATGPVPTVLVVHGGPHAAWGDNLHLEHQILARHGIGVLWVNPRGSSGYGRAYSDAVVGHWGEGDMNDLMAAVDRAVADGKADPNRLAIMGTSYGGFMSSWVIGHDRRFSTAVIQAPVVNQISMYGTSDIGSYFLRYQLGGLSPHGDLTAMWDKSPLKYVPEVQASVLLICGENDDRCPIGQSEEYYTALREAGRDVAFLRYPGEPHGLAVIGTPSHRLHRQQAVVDWLAERLDVSQDFSNARTAVHHGVAH